MTNRWVSHYEVVGFPGEAKSFLTSESFYVDNSNLIAEYIRRSNKNNYKYCWTDFSNS